MPANRIKLMEMLPEFIFPVECYSPISSGGFTAEKTMPRITSQGTLTQKRRGLQEELIYR